MIFINELRPLTLYKRPFHLPVNIKNKRKGNVTFLLTPNYDSSKKLLNNPLLINRNYYESYYLEKSVMYFIQNEGYVAGDLNLHSINEISDELRKYKNRMKYKQTKRKYAQNAHRKDKESNLTGNNIGAGTGDTANVKMAQPKLATPQLSAPKLKESADDFELPEFLTEDHSAARYLNPESPDDGEMDFNLVNEKSKGKQKKSKTVPKANNEDHSAARYLNPESPDDGEMDFNLVNEASKKKDKKVPKTNNEDHSAARYLNPESPDDGEMDFNMVDEAGKAKKKKVPDIENEDHSACQYLNPDSPDDGEMDFNFVNETYMGIMHEAVVEDEYMIRMRTESGDSIMFINPECTDRDFLNESLKFSNYNYNKLLYNILYNERIKTNKDIFNIYDKVMADVPYIKKVYLGLDKYKSYNTFIDLSYYNNAFFENNKYAPDKGLQIYLEFLRRMIDDKRLPKYGYKEKTVFIPVNDWLSGNAKSDLNYKNNLNPISIIIKMLKDKHYDILKKFKGTTFMFIGDNGYFKVDLSEINNSTFSRFMGFLNKLEIKVPIVEEEPSAEPTKKAIVADVVAKIEDSQNVKINNLTGKETKDQKEMIKDEPIVDKKLPTDLNATSVKSYNLDGNGTEIDKNELVEKIQKAAVTSKTADDTIDNMVDDEEAIDLVQQIADAADDNVKINPTRAARINKLQSEFLEKKVKGNKNIKQMIETSTTDIPIPKTELKIDTVNDGWKDLSYVNFEKIYDPSDDIVSMLNSFSKKTVPVAVRSLSIEDHSTSEDYLDTYIVDLEDAHGSRFKIKFDVPQLIDHKFMKLRGNQKTIAGQLTLLPISKTNVDTVQIVSNYKKIIISTHYTTTGKSNVISDRLIKTLSKNEFTGLKIKDGDNSQICRKYELPIDYIDFATRFSTIENSKFIIDFNLDNIYEALGDKINNKNGIPYGYTKDKKEIFYYDGNGGTFSKHLLNNIFADIPKFMDAYNNTNPGNKYTYSRASILNTDVPLIVVMAFSVGLTKAMDEANIKYQISEKKFVDKKDDEWGMIRFADGYISYENNYASSLLMNGLKDCGTEQYSLTEINKKSTYINMLENFGSRIISDGLDNFYDLMIDPITEEVLKDYKLPTDYISLLAYANLLLGDNKYTRHIDMTGRRYRSNELIAGYAYQALADSYGAYRTELRKRGKGAMTIKQDAIIIKIMGDPTSSDLSILNDLQLSECINAVSYKGLAGMNNDRGYGLDKRSYDESMVNILGIATGFAGNVGLTRQTTIDMNVKSKRGYLAVNPGTDNMGVTKTLTVTEALTPFGTTRDDPFRQAMTFIQTAKHGMRVKHGSPSLISNGADQALPHLTPNFFTFKAKEDGTVLEKTDDYMILKYKSGETDFVNLKNEVRKNSNGGFYANVKLDTDLKQGSKVKANNVIAYDKLSYSNKIGESGNVAYKLGTLAKVAILSTDEGFEDSAKIDENLAENMASEVVVMKDVTLDKNTNVYNMVKVGQQVKEGDPLIIFQEAFEDNDVNILLKNLAGDEKEISELGRIKVKSKISGYIQDIKVYRTVETSELSPSLKKLVNEYERPIKELKKTMAKHGLNTNKITTTESMATVGKLKNAESAVYIEFYLCYEDKMSIGDKIIYYSALKGVIKDIFPKGMEPTTKFRPNEPINALLSIGSVNGRMVCSIKPNLGITKVLVELDRAIKDKLGYKWTDINKE